MKRDELLRVKEEKKEVGVQRPGELLQGAEGWRGLPKGLPDLNKNTGQTT